jgi:hypothetical protein
MPKSIDHLEQMFENPPKDWFAIVSAKADTITLAVAKGWANEKYEYLAEQGLITQNQLALAKTYVEWSSLKDLLAFKMGWKGSLSSIFSNNGL